MADKVKLLSLVKRVRESDGPDRDLDGDICAAVYGWRHYGGGYVTKGFTPSIDEGDDCPRYTKWLSDARRLIDPPARWRMTSDEAKGQCEAHVYYSDHEFATGAAPRETHALIIAALLAKIDAAD